MYSCPLHISSDFCTSVMPSARIHFLLYLLALSYAASGCRNIIVTEPAGSNPMADFNTAWQDVNLVYPYFAYKKINWDSIRTVYLSRAQAARGDEIDGVLFDMLAELKDGHVSLQTQGGASVSTYHPPRVAKDRYAYDPRVVRRYFDQELRLAGNQRIEYGIINGGVGYIYVATMSKDEPVIAGFDEALTYVKDTKGLIIDVRHNGGGSDYNSVGIENRLISSPIDGLPYYASDGTLRQGGYIAPRGPFQYTGAVVMLINGVCFSACEDFAEMMKHVPTVTAVGDTTAGASGAPQSYALPSGRMINISTKNIPRYDGLPIEWNGVPPDIRIAQTEEDIRQGRDLQLEYAIRFLQ
jgi:carboxyl-terminal processing protease